MRIDQLGHTGRWELDNNVMPFWLDYLKHCEQEGKFAVMDFSGRLDFSRPTSTILLCRILWSFSAYYRLTGTREYLSAARYLHLFISDRCIDSNTGFLTEHTSSNDLEPKLSEFKTLTQAYGIYAFAEFAGATNSRKDCEQALSLISRLELAARTGPNGLYTEAIFTGARNDASRAQNTIDTRCQLHLVEAYVCLLRVRKDERVMELLADLLESFNSFIYSQSKNNFPLQIDTLGKSTKKDISYGHNLEAAWLLFDAATVTDKRHLVEAFGQHMTNLVDATIKNAMNDNGAIWTWMYADGEQQKTMVWWVQVEAINAFLQCFEYTQKERYFSHAQKLWGFVSDNFKDLELGEWYTCLFEDARVDLSADKVGPWRGPYHIVRTCLCMIEFGRRLNNDECSFIGRAHVSR